MSNVRITKASSAQRQIDAAIRMLFAGEDALAVHTVAAAAHGIILDLAEKRGVGLLNEFHEAGIRAMARELLGKTISDNDIRRQLPAVRSWVRKVMNRPANFLKHADRDSEGTLDLNTLDTDTPLLWACALYNALGFDFTTEMKAFARWHLAVYPGEPDDQLKTAAGYVHDLPRPQQLEVGDFLLALYRGSQ